MKPIIVCKPLRRINYAQPNFELRRAVAAPVRTSGLETHREKAKRTYLSETVLDIRI